MVLVVAYALVGNLRGKLQQDSLGTDKNGFDVFLKDIWPTSEEIQKTIKRCVTPAMFAQRYKDVFKGNKQWRDLNVDKNLLYIPK